MTIQKENQYLTTIFEKNQELAKLQDLENGYYELQEQNHNLEEEMQNMVDVSELAKVNVEKDTLSAEVNQLTLMLGKSKNKINEYESKFKDMSELRSKIRETIKESCTNDELREKLLQDLDTCETYHEVEKNKGYQ